MIPINYTIAKVQHSKVQHSEHSGEHAYKHYRIGIVTLWGGEGVCFGAKKIQLILKMITTVSITSLSFASLFVIDFPLISTSLIEFLDHNFISLLLRLCPRADSQPTCVACEAAFLVPCLARSNLSYSMFAWSSTAHLAASCSVITKWSHFERCTGGDRDGDQWTTNQTIAFHSTVHSLNFRPPPFKINSV